MEKVKNKVGVANPHLLLYLLLLLLIFLLFLYKWIIYFISLYQTIGGIKMLFRSLINDYNFIPVEACGGFELSKTKGVF